MKTTKLIHMVRHGRSEQNKLMEDWLVDQGFGNVGVHAVVISFPFLCARFSLSVCHQMSGKLGEEFPFKDFIGQVSSPMKFAHLRPCSCLMLIYVDMRVRRRCSRRIYKTTLL